MRKIRRKVKSPALKARDPTLKLCSKPRLVKGPEGLYFTSRWLSKAAVFAWSNPKAAKILIGTLENFKKKGVVGVKAPSRAGASSITVDEAKAVLKLCSRTKIIGEESLFNKLFPKTSIKDFARGTIQGAIITRKPRSNKKTQ